MEMGKKAIKRDLKHYLLKEKIFKKKINKNISFTYSDEYILINDYNRILEGNQIVKDIIKIITNKNNIESKIADLTTRYLKSDINEGLYLLEKEKIIYE